MKLIKKEYIKVLEWGFKIAYLLLGLSTFNLLFMIPRSSRRW